MTVDVTKIDRAFKAEWTIEMVDELPLIVVKDPVNGTRAPTMDEAQNAVNILNENSGSTTVQLYCRTDNCAGKGGYITRTVADSKKNIYACDICHKPMVK